MNVIIKNIKKKKNFYKYSESVETYISQMLSKQTNLPIQPVTTGFSPRYDFILGDKKIEVKITSKCKPEIEFCRYDARPSGLMTTHSDYYLIISPGGSKGKFVGKIRLIETDQLKLIMLDKIFHNEYTRYMPKFNSPGAMVYQLDPKQTDDIWLGDCDLLFENRQIVGFDLESYKPVKNLFKKI